MTSRILTALPVFNEATHVPQVLEQVLQHADHVLVVDDGSTDSTHDELMKFGDRIHVVRHNPNQGYGAALKTSFDYAARYGFDVLVTIDCDGQHQPGLIGQIAQPIQIDDSIDMVSGSRYLKVLEGNTLPPEERRRINFNVTECLNEKLGFELTDSFCGFKAYRVSSLGDLDITIPGYAMPLQLWIQAAHLNWKVVEHAVPLVYLDEDRSFGGSLDDAKIRLKHYREVLNTELARQGMQQRFTADCGQGIS